VIPVAAFSVISDVSETLRTVLRTGLQAIDPNLSVRVDNLLGPDPQAPALTLFLFEILEDPSTRNQPRVRVPQANGVKIRKPDLTLVLRYLITPWIDNLNAPYTDQLLLGRITQVFYENAILAGPQLQGTTLAGTSSALKVTMAPLTLEDRTRIWGALHKDYRLSITYEVRVIRIEPLDAQLVGTVNNRRLEHGEVEGEP
jgi:hypothetical protein